jgi:membrane-associated protease RseP (regulator of RpoE activity)
MSTRSIVTLILAAALVGGACLASWPGLAAAAADEQEHAWLGVLLRSTDDAPGAVVAEVYADSPAEQAGLEEGDAILRVAERPVQSPKDIIEALRERAPGDSLAITIGRDGTESVVDAVLGERPADFAAKIAGFDPGALREELRLKLGGLEDLPKRLQEQVGTWETETKTVAYLGLRLVGASEELKRALGSDEGRGVLVDGVEPETAAADAGLRAGDLILELDGEPVAGRRAFQKAIAERDPGDGVSLYVLRDQAPLTVTATLGERTRTTRIIRIDPAEGGETTVFEMPEVPERAPSPEGMADAEEIRIRIDTSLEGLGEELDRSLSMLREMSLEGLDEGLAEALESLGDLGETQNGEIIALRGTLVAL